MASNFTPTPAKKTALNHAKLKLSSPNGEKDNNGREKKASLAWNISANNPRLVVYTNVDSDMTEKNKGGQILAALDTPTFFAVIQSINNVASTEGENKIKLSNMNHTFMAGKRSDKPLLQSEIYIGKDADGRVWISVTHFNKERPRIKFYFGPVEEYHQWTHSNGEPFTKAEVSVLYAKAYANILTELVPHLLVTEYVEPPPFNGKGNQQSSNKSSDSFGDADELF